MESKYIRDLHAALYKTALEQKAWGNTVARNVVDNCLSHLIALAAEMDARQKVEHMEKILRDHHLTAGAPTNERPKWAGPEGGKG